MAKETHCAFCGSAFDKTEGWPRKCSNCNRMTFRNPLPVAVVVQPIRRADGTLGVLCIRRGIPPQVGYLALPGGYVDLGEDWRVAGAREVQEEAANQRGEAEQYSGRKAANQRRRRKTAARQRRTTAPKAQNSARSAQYSAVGAKQRRRR